MVVGGEVVTLKSIEESTGIVMQEMPMQVSLFALIKFAWPYQYQMQFIPVSINF